MGCHDVRLFAEQLPEIPGMVTSEAAKCMAAVMVHMTIVADADGTSTRYAKVRASHNALAVLKGLPPFEYRQKFGCDCQEKAEDGDGEMDGMADGISERVGTAI